MAELIEKAAALRVIFDSVGKPATEIYQAIWELPAAEAAEREPAEWTITESWPHRVICTRCYHTFAQANWEIWKDGSLPRNFCPSCGARMQLGTKEEDGP